ncbi:DUF397 domain-containing protein [Spongiactinospora sp. 9N601]|uniref:DUF397 domain-containing protein n=1 Tax=Spongiactinospora sp. 9N601 TaxID=3375149 RepID=UPI00378D1E02
MAVWRKSRRSSGGGGNCVEVADNIPGVIGVGAARNPTDPMLCPTPDDWRAFIAHVKGPRCAAR